MLLRASNIANPLTGLFTVAPDTSAVAPLVVALANRYAEYELSGSTAWDRTVDVRSRPRWLREAATVATAQADDRADGKGTEESARGADEEKLVWTAVNADQLEPVEVPPAARDDGMCGGSLLLFDGAPCGGISTEV